ncbi:MAG: SDR family oxidoreductase [Microbacteriaceae bacterium]|nr:MAG: SDR family oxidoreductase [Microbacteriaceae bacterium]
MQGLSGLRVMVTGAAGGIGRAVVDRLRTEGAVVMGVDMVQPVDDALAFAGIADVTDEDSVTSVFDSAVREVGAIDALVATAGIQVTKPTHELTTAEFRKVLDVSVIGTFVTTKYVIPRMLAAGGGRIVTFGSTAAICSAPRLAAYAAAKGAVLQYTRSIAAEYGGRGIRSNCICPGGTMTAMMKDIDASSNGSDKFLERHPIGRYADPSEIAAGVAFLVSDDSSFVLGANFMVDGGYSIG